MGTGGFIGLPRGTVSTLAVPQAVVLLAVTPSRSLNARFHARSVVLTFAPPWVRSRGALSPRMTRSRRAIARSGAGRAATPSSRGRICA